MAIRSFTLVTGLLSASLIATVLVNPAHAAGRKNPSALSDQLFKSCDFLHPLECIWWDILDPPGDISQIGFEIKFIPAMISIDLADSGFLCDFSAGGDCPAVAPNTVSQGFVPLTVGAPRTGTSFSLILGADTVTLLADLSANPPPSGTDRNFFALAFKTVEPQNISSVQFSNSPGVGDMFQVAGPSQVCTLVGGGECGSDNPGQGFTFIPEPSSVALLGAGLLFVTALRRHHSSRFKA